MMGSGKLVGIVATVVLYAVLVEYKHSAAAAPGRSGHEGGAAALVENGRRVRNRPLLRLPARPFQQYPRSKQDIGEFIVDDDDFFELNKRQTSDDYGHLRFGKREDFDDYGHMRFGRNSEKKK